MAKPTCRRITAPIDEWVTCRKPVSERPCRSYHAPVGNVGAVDESEIDQNSDQDEQVVEKSYDPQRGLGEDVERKYEVEQEEEEDQQDVEPVDAEESAHGEQVVDQIPHQCQEIVQIAHQLCMREKEKEIGDWRERTKIRNDSNTTAMECNISLIQYRQTTGSLLGVFAAITNFPSRSCLNFIKYTHLCRINTILGNESSCIFVCCYIALLCIVTLFCKIPRR